ncbi:MAG: SBBP repeat-containing protein [Fimbriimonadales bacterium]
MNTNRTTLVYAFVGFLGGLLMPAAAQTQEWVARYNGPGKDFSNDSAVDVAADAQGNVYVTGYSYGSGNFDYATVKYDSAGKEQWVARYNGANGDDFATALATDGSGNVYVTGYSWNGSNREDYATIKYDSEGNEQWVARYHGGSWVDKAYAVAVDPSGNVYVTGESHGSIGSDYATIKYDSSGKEQWVARGPEESVLGERAVALAVDASGNVYVTGTVATLLTTLTTPRSSMTPRATNSGSHATMEGAIPITPTRWR